MIRNQDLCSRCAYCYWSVITSQSSQWTDVECTHADSSPSICWTWWNLQFQSKTTGLISVFPLFILVTLFSDVEKSVSTTLKIIAIYSVLEYTSHASAKNKPTIIIQYSFIFCFSLKVQGQNAMLKSYLSYFFSHPLQCD